MNKSIEIIQGNTYIFKGKNASNDKTYIKYKILEITDTTYLIKNMDTDIILRVGIVDFNYDYKPIEIIKSHTMSNKIDIKYSGIPNICFSLTDKNDSREKEFSEQRIKNGFDESETWSLRDTIANFIIPRLELYMKIVPNKKDIKNMDKIKSFLDAMKLVARDNGIFILTDDEKKILNDGLQNFHKIFLNLSW